MKNSDLLHYKGYTARPEYSVEDRVFYGTILGIDDMVDFQSESAKDLEEQFHKAVDDYCKFCAEIREKDPKRSTVVCLTSVFRRNCTGSFRCSAQAEGISLNKAVEQAIRTMVPKLRLVRGYSLYLACFNKYLIKQNRPALPGKLRNMKQYKPYRFMFFF